MSTTEAAASGLEFDPRDDRSFLGHPKGLAYLAFTEAWERFSFYGMQFLLVLYMVKFLLLPGQVETVAGIEQLRSLFGGIEGQQFASAIFGTYAACAYLTPILGGWVADRWLGKNYTVLLGAMTMAAGHILMAFNFTFLLALVLLILGSGLLKGNIASQVGSLYKPDDLRRGDAFQIFYLALNAGIIAAPLIIGTLGEKVGWHYGFGAAGIGMLVGLVIYISGQKYLPEEHLSVSKKTGEARVPMNRNDWTATIALVLLIPVMAIAIVPNNQFFNAFLIWADRDFALQWGDMLIPTTWLGTFHAIVGLGSLLLVAMFYRWYAKYWTEPDEFSKMIISSLFSMAGMACLYVAAITATEGEKISLIWPALQQILNAIAVAHLLPVSLSLFARFAPKQINATMIGLYYFNFFIAYTLVGWVGGWFETMNVADFWLIHLGFSAASGALFLAFKLLLSKRMMLDTEQVETEAEQGETAQA